MLTIAVASLKGGTAKSTLCAALGVWIAEATNSGKVALLDLNYSQGSLIRWWTKRGRPLSPWLLEEMTNFKRDLAVLRNTGWTHVVIDTPPFDVEVVEMAVILADITIIPVKASDFDEAAARAVSNVCQQRRKPFAFLLSIVDGRTQFKSHNDMIAARLKEMGTPVLKTRFPYSLYYLKSLETGETGHEIDPKCKKRPENPEDETGLRAVMRDLWAEILALRPMPRTTHDAKGLRHVH